MPITYVQRIHLFISPSVPIEFQPPLPSLSPRSPTPTPTLQPPSHPTPSLPSSPSSSRPSWSPRSSSSSSNNSRVVTSPRHPRPPPRPTRTATTTAPRNPRTRVNIHFAIRVHCTHKCSTNDTQVTIGIMLPMHWRRSIVFWESLIWGIFVLALVGARWSSRAEVIVPRTES